MTSQLVTLDDLDLLGSLSLEIHQLDEVKCQVIHDSGLPCTVEVTHRVTSTCNGLALLACESAAQTHVQRMKHPDTFCGACLKPCSRCWKVVPV